MRALVIGRGSMGKRRIRDLTALGVEVESWDPMTDSVIPMLSRYDFRVISTPPATHYKYADTRADCFTEADVVFVEAGPRRFPSATPLFTDWWPEVQNAHGDHRIKGYSLHVGQNIGDWHPGADPKTYYAYREETGPTREMVPFELTWLRKLFGGFEASGTRGREVAQVALEHIDGTRGSIFIDALSRPAVRVFDFVCDDGEQRRWNLWYDEQTYAREMRALVAAVKGEAPWPYSQAEEAANLEVLRMIERSD